LSSGSLMGAGERTRLYIDSVCSDNECTQNY